jgi:hypothetical protein
MSNNVSESKIYKSLALQHLGFTQFGDDLFWCVSFSFWHFLPPFRPIISFYLDQFLGGRSKVIDGIACPNRFDATNTSTPFLSIIEAAVCLRSWIGDLASLLSKHFFKS